MARMEASAARWRAGRAMVDRDGFRGREACDSRDGNAVGKPSSPEPSAQS